MAFGYFMSISKGSWQMCSKLTIGSHEWTWLYNLAKFTWLVGGQRVNLHGGSNHTNLTNTKIIQSLSSHVHFGYRGYYSAHSERVSKLVILILCPLDITLRVGRIGISITLIPPRSTCLLFSLQVGTTRFHNLLIQAYKKGVLHLNVWFWLGLEDY